MQLVVEVQRTLLSALMSPLMLPAGLGTDARAHLLPFQCSSWWRSTVLRAWVPYRPAAQQLADEGQTTSNSSLMSLLRLPHGVGVATNAHFLPSQCTAWSRSAPPLIW